MERGIRSVDKLSVLIDIAKVLHVKVETLSGQPFSLAPNGEPDLDGMDAIQEALGAYPGLGVSSPPPTQLTDIGRMTTEVHLRYQSADYAAAARILPSLIKSADWLVVDSHGDERRALKLQCSVYVAAAKKMYCGVLAKTSSLNTAAMPSKTAPMPDTIISAPANTASPVATGDTPVLRTPGPLTVDTHAAAPRP